VRPFPAGCASLPFSLIKKKRSPIPCLLSLSLSLSLFYSILYLPLSAALHLPFSRSDESRGFRAQCCIRAVSALRKFYHHPWRKRESERERERERDPRRADRSHYKGSTEEEEEEEEGDRARISMGNSFAECRGGGRGGLPRLRDCSVAINYRCRVDSSFLLFPFFYYALLFPSLPSPPRRLEASAMRGCGFHQSRAIIR